MNFALVVIDVQNEFVADPRMPAGADAFLPRVAALLHAFRERSLPVLHVHYVTEPDGRGLLPHHRTEGRLRCVRGSQGASPHPVAEPQDQDPVFAKHSYSAFTASDFDACLRRLNVDTLVICGLYTHACVRQTALDGLEKGFNVQIAHDAVASYDVLHAQVTRTYLTDRGVAHSDSWSLIDRLPGMDQPLQGATDGHSAESLVTHPVACVEAMWIPRNEQPLEELRNPSRWDQILGYVPMADARTIDTAVVAAVRAQHTWQARPPDERISMVESWADILASRADEFLPQMITEVGKPVSACRFEMGLLRDSLQVMRDTFTCEPDVLLCTRTDDQIAVARRRPRGVIAILAPWNNPVFLPASKIAASLALGNGVVWKPAIPCAATSALLQDSLLDAGFPAGLVNLVYGGAETAGRLIAHAGISAVTITGSVETGREVAATCGSLLKPLQAELGGNNATIVTRHCNLREVADKIALSAFAYAGQACTATRRLVVLASVEKEFMPLLKQSVQALIIGEPGDEATSVGPVISKTHLKQVEQWIAEAGERASIFESTLPDGLAPTGCWMPPRIIQGLPPSAPLVQNESFAPVLVVQTAPDIHEAIRLCNGVQHGLIAALFSDDENEVKVFRDSVETGVVQLNLPTRNLHMESPFGGWKASGLGPPEHGVWDLDFYTQWQAVNESLLPSIRS